MRFFLELIDNPRTSSYFSGSKRREKTEGKVICIDFIVIAQLSNMGIYLAAAATKSHSFLLLHTQKAKEKKV